MIGISDEDCPRSIYINLVSIDVYEEAILNLLAKVNPKFRLDCLAFRSRTRARRESEGGFSSTNAQKTSGYVLGREAPSPCLDLAFKMLITAVL